MAEKIVWSDRSEKELFEILEYWSNRNKSKTYSIKLKELIVDSVELLTQSPESGIATKFRNVRIKIVGAYLIYYRIHTEHIEILALWDSRRNPKKFKL